MKIYKSNFTAEELERWEALIAKGQVAPEDNQEEMEDEAPAFPPKKPAKKAEVEDTDEDAKKSALPQFVLDAIAKSDEFMTRIEKQEMSEVAKKYAILGENPDELADKLYNLKKSDESMYQTCIAMLDKQVNLIQKSGTFSEIGKSTGGYSAAGTAEGKAEAKAREIMKADPNCTYEAAITKACMDDPALMAEYDAEYFGRR